MQPGLISVTVMLALALLLDPGCVVYRATASRGGTLDSLALAPALSAAFVFVVGGLAQLVGFSFGPSSFVNAKGAASPVAGSRWRRNRDGDGTVPDGAPSEAYHLTALAFLRHRLSPDQRRVVFEPERPELGRGLDEALLRPRDAQ